MSRGLSFRYLQPTFFSGLLDDPVLVVRIGPLGRSLLFDCGQIHHLAKRVLRSVETLFISHAHMDHFMGIDTFTRNVHVSPKSIDLFGPPGLAEKLEHKLKGYDWNLAGKSWCSYLVHEVFQNRIRTFVLPGSEAFTCRFAGEEIRKDLAIYQDRYFEVETEICDHNLPVLIFRLTERPAFCVDKGKIEEMGLVRGPWLKELKEQFYGGRLGAEALPVLRRQGERVEEEAISDTAGLYEEIRQKGKPGSIGYVTDIGATAENLEKVITLMKGVDLLICECTFLAEHREKARKSFHLCTEDLNGLADRIGPDFLLPMHLSKTYLRRSHLLYEELEPPSGTKILRIPDYLTPRPLLPSEVPGLVDRGLSRTSLPGEEREKMLPPSNRPCRGTNRRDPR